MAIVLNFNGSETEKTHDKCKTGADRYVSPAMWIKWLIIFGGCSLWDFTGPVAVCVCACARERAKCRTKSTAHSFSIIHAIALYNLFDVCISFWNGFLMWAFEFWQHMKAIRFRQWTVCVRILSFVEKMCSGSIRPRWRNKKSGQIQRVYICLSIISN